MAIQANVFNITSNTVTGNRVVTGLGFQPKIVRFMLSGLRNGTVETFVHFSEGSTDGTNQICHSLYSNAGTEHTSVFIDRVINLETPSGPITASIVSLDSDGFTLNFTNTVSGYRITGEALA